MGGQSLSKPSTEVAATRTATPTRSNRPPELVPSTPNGAPVSPVSNYSLGSSIPIQAPRMDEHGSEATLRTRRDSTIYSSTDAGSPTTCVDHPQLNYGKSWGRKPNFHLLDPAQLPRSNLESYGRLSNGTRVFEIRLMRERYSLRILCPLLRGALRRASINSLSASQREDSVSPELVIHEPYEWIFHNWKKISQAASEDEGKCTSLHAELLLEFIKAERPTTWGKLNEVESGECEKIAFEDLWLIYPAGVTVFAKDDGAWRAYKVERTDSNSPSSSGLMSIHCLYLDLDPTGQRLTPHREVLSIQSYTSERPIADLQVVPEWCFQGRNDLHDQLLKRGKSFWEHTRKVYYKEYSGDAWPRSSRKDPVSIIIDYVTSSKHIEVTGNASDTSYGGSTCSVCLGEVLGLPSYPTGASHDLDDGIELCGSSNRKNEESSLDVNAALLFCPPRIWAFSLTHKSWESILPKDIGEVRRQDDALAELEMVADHKNYLESALLTHLRDGQGVNSGGMVRRKGRGFNILLHGGPGTGKTLTAEWLAAKHVVPLYKITCGELGMDVDILEKRLQEVFLRATNWRALLLLDDADIFIKTRSIQDLRRYAIVSIFLHQLDDSEALLLMTTNHVDLDPSLGSRVDIAIPLPRINFESQKRIWKIWIRHLGSLAPNQVQVQVLEQFIEFDLETAEEGAYITMNGRQIRSCISAASALARQDGERLGITHIRKILRLGRDFRELMHKTSSDPRATYEYYAQLPRQGEQQKNGWK
ncbi:hypothetical protein NUW58_g1665 [Xylaria curta]|uniref:Uncharacterized protein n=1 Tax=Xylaria curta TaxID=42375 RepID=A0ACC1PJ46_9PEZI|nr:hypothetical protein NUW58_g1665 [Xylaria curta]